MASTSSEAEQGCAEASRLLGAGTKESTVAAIDAFSRLVGRFPSSAAAHAGLAAGYCMAMIRYGHPRTNVEAAISHAKRSIELDPTRLLGHTALTRAYFVKGDIRGALATSMRAYELDPAHQDTVDAIAFLHLDLGELDAAMEWSRRALQINSGSAFAHRNVARLMLMFREPAEASRSLDRCLTLQPDFPSARVLLVYLHVLRGAIDRARQEARAMLDHRPDDPETLNFAADEAFIRGDIPAARALFERAIVAGADSRNFYRGRRAKTGLGYVLWLEGNRPAAKTLFDDRIAARTAEFRQGLNCWGPPYELAAISAATGHTDEALSWLRHAVDRGWREPDLATTDRLLENLKSNRRFGELLESAWLQVKSMKPPSTALR